MVCWSTELSESSTTATVAQTCGRRNPGRGRGQCFTAGIDMPSRRATSALQLLLPAFAFLQDGVHAPFSHPPGHPRRLQPPRWQKRRLLWPADRLACLQERVGAHRGATSLPLWNTPVGPNCCPTPSQPHLLFDLTGRAAPFQLLSMLLPLTTVDEVYCKLRQGVGPGSSAQSALCRRLARGGSRTCSGMPCCSQSQRRPPAAYLIHLAWRV